MNHRVTFLFIYLSKACIGGSRNVHPPPPTKFLQYHAVFAEILSNNLLAPSSIRNASEKSWIRVDFISQKLFVKFRAFPCHKQGSDNMKSRKRKSTTGSVTGVSHKFYLSVLSSNTERQRIFASRVKTLMKTAMKRVTININWGLRITLWGGGRAGGVGGGRAETHSTLGPFFHFHAVFKKDWQK